MPGETADVIQQHGEIPLAKIWVRLRGVQKFQKIWSLRPPRDPFGGDSKLISKIILQQLKKGKIEKCKFTMIEGVLIRLLHCLHI